MEEVARVDIYCPRCSEFYESRDRSSDYITKEKKVRCNRCGVEFIWKCIGSRYVSLEKEVVIGS